MAINFIHMDKLISLQEAIKSFGLSEPRLRELIQEGLIKAAILPGGEIGVSAVFPIAALNSRLQEITRSQFDHLNEWITVSEAVRKYNISIPTLRMWQKNQYIQTQTATYPQRVNEGDVAYCVAIFNERKKAGVRAGAPLLDADKKPYQLKHPALSEYRRRKSSELA